MRWMFLATAALAIVGLPVHAQTVHEVPLAGVALISLNKDGRVSSCGVRVVGVQALGSRGKVFDTSIYLSEKGIAAGQITGSTVESLAPGAKQSDVPVFGGWFRAVGQPATRPKDGFKNGASPGTKAFITDFEPALHFVNDAVSRKPVQIGVSWSEGADTVYTGPVKIEEGQAKQIYGCLHELTANMTRDTTRGQ